MVIILAVLLLALILGGLGFAVHVLWWIALIVLVLWLLGFFFTGARPERPQAPLVSLVAARHPFTPPLDEGQRSWACATGSKTRSSHGRCTGS